MRPDVTDALEGEREVSFVSLNWPTEDGWADAIGAHIGEASRNHHRAGHAGASGQRPWLTCAASAWGSLNGKPG